MEDTEMLEQQSPEPSQVNLVDAGVQQQPSTHPSEDQNTNETISDKTLTLPTDVNMSDSPALPNKPDNKSSHDANTNSCNAAPAEPLEKKSNGDAAPLPSFTPKSGPKTVEKSKNWLLDPEVHKKCHINRDINIKVSIILFIHFVNSMFCCLGYRWGTLMKLEHRRSEQHS